MSLRALVSDAPVASRRDATASSGLAKLLPVCCASAARVVEANASVNASRLAVWRSNLAPRAAVVDIFFEVFMVSRFGFGAKTGFISGLLPRLLLALLPL